MSVFVQQSMAVCSAVMDKNKDTPDRKARAESNVPTDSGIESAPSPSVPTADHPTVKTVSVVRFVPLECLLTTNKVIDNTSFRNVGEAIFCKKNYPCKLL